MGRVNYWAFCSTFINQIKTLIKVAAVQVIFPCLFYLFLAAGERKSKEAAHFGIDDPPSFIEFALC